MLLQEEVTVRDLRNNLRVAVVQAEPALFDQKTCLEKALKKIEECAENGAELVVFPELYIPGYPFGMNFGFATGCRNAPGREDWKRYYDNSLLADGPEIGQLCDAAKKHGIYLSMGYSERDGVTGTLYNSNVMIDPEGRRMNHRKLKPTGSERLVWGDANRDYFPVMDTPWGPMGCLICWESYMPLARVALYNKGITIYISPNTNDNPEWQATIQHIAIEGKCYFINADMLIRKSSYPAGLNGQDEIDRLPDMVCRGGSCIIDPYGHYVTEPVWDEETIIYADLNMTLPAACKMEHDAAGHYARPDVLELIVHEI